MKKLIIPILTGLVMASCVKDVEICIDGDMNPSEPGTYTYTWCGEKC